MRGLLKFTPAAALVIAAIATSEAAIKEINYPAVMRKLLEMKYTGYVGQEFIPTRNPMEGLRQAVHLCDV